MKKEAVLLMGILLLAGSSYGWSTKTDVDPKKKEKTAIDAASAQIEVYEEKPKKPYIIVAPIRDDSGTHLLTRKSQDALFANLKRKAAKLGADAIINLDCGATTQMRSRGYANRNFGYLKGRSVEAPYCQGTAIKWK